MWNLWMIRRSFRKIWNRWICRGFVKKTNIVGLAWLTLTLWPKSSLIETWYWLEFPILSKLSQENENYDDVQEIARIFSMLQNNYDDIFMSSAIIMRLLKTILFVVSNSFLLSWLVQFIRDLRTFMILRPAKNSLKELMLGITLGKNRQASSF